MEDITTKIEKIWHSERLIYRGLRPEDQDFLFHAVEEDPVNCCLATPMLLSPTGKMKPDEFWSRFNIGPNKLLCVMVCLATADSLPNGSAVDTTPSTPPASAEETKTKPAEPTPIGFLNLDYGGYGTSPFSRSATLGITIIKPYQNSGYGTEVVNWALDWGFRHANLHSIHLGSIEYNTRAHRCYEKCGFTLDGRRRQCFWHDRKYWDLYFFSIVEDEWEELRKKALK